MRSKKDIKRICEYRGVPVVELGQRCIVDGISGVITGVNSSCNFLVKFDGHTRNANCHPYWRMRIFNQDGSVFYEHKDN